MKRLGGSHVLMTRAKSMLSPGPKCETAAPPTQPSISLGTNQDEIPGPVAIASQTSSGVPCTSASA